MISFDDKTYGPRFMREFQCIADRCRHSCCIGWEIDVDEVSLERYRNVQGPLGEKLKQCISEEFHSAHFILGENERCPFLNEKNLCELILGLGEDSLCDICREHPRFRNFYTDREEVGLGLCCEEAGRILLTQRAPIEIVDLTENSEHAGTPEDTASQPDESITDETLHPDGYLASYENSDGYLTTAEKVFLSQRSQIFSLLQDRTRNLEMRVHDILEFCGSVPLRFDPVKWGHFLRSLERLDPSWDEEISLLENAQNIDTSAFYAFMQKQGREVEYENLLWYFLYRHLSVALEADGADEQTPDEEDLRTRVLFAMTSTKIIGYLGACHFAANNDFTLDDQIELARMYSSEIEYSDENVEKFLEYLSE